MGAGGGVGLARELIDCPRGGQGLVGARAAAETSLERFHLLTATLRRTGSRSGRRCGRRHRRPSPTRLSTPYGSDLLRDGLAERLDKIRVYVCVYIICVSIR